jgi:hypothetical protein
MMRLKEDFTKYEFKLKFRILKLLRLIEERHDMTGEVMPKTSDGDRLIINLDTW